MPTMVRTVPVLTIFGSASGDRDRKVGSEAGSRRGSEDSCSKRFPSFAEQMGSIDGVSLGSVLCFSMTEGGTVKLTMERFLQLPSTDPN